MVQKSGAPVEIGETLIATICPLFHVKLAIYRHSSSINNMAMTCVDASFYPEEDAFFYG